MSRPKPRAHGEPVIISADGSAVGLQRSLNDVRLTENRLQDLVHRHPEILPIAEIEPAFTHPISVCRELRTQHGPIDNLLITPEGNLIVVEAKLWRNPEARRKVVAQALDYASCLFELDYEGLERAVLDARAGEGDAAKSLYEIFASLDEAPGESQFVDAINLNLRRGRALILVVGDGIRTETERLVDLFQSHGTAHFTFALVELALYSLDETGRLLICPRTLAKTEIIGRTTIELEGLSGKTRPLSKAIGTIAPPSSSTRAPSITAEQFFESVAKIDPRAPEEIEKLQEEFEKLGVFEEYATRLMFKWDSPLDKTYNIGSIRPDGRVPTRAVNWFAPTDLSHTYIEELAAAWGMQVNRNHLRDWFVAGPDGKTVTLAAILGKLELWPAVLERFQNRIRERAEKSRSG
ncbi:MAG: hypothetical protein JNM20_19495 [Rhizobiales bacterium]|nr:hypothetical protein [Hyphomicrobiales bacterium]